MEVVRTAWFVRLSICAAASAIVLAAIHTQHVANNSKHGMNHAVTAPGSVDQEPAVTLKRIVETRSLDITKPGENDMFMMSSDQPALTLTFSLRLPAGTQLMDIEQPADVVATDSSGADLSKIEPGFRDEREYIEQVYDFEDDDDLCDLTLQLTPSSRAAQTFSVQTTFNASIFTGSKPVQIQAGPNWTPLEVEAADFARPVRFRVDDGGLTLEPSDIQKRIERIDVHVNGNEVSTGNGWFSDGTSITYMFDELPDARPLTFTIVLRTGVRTIPLTLNVKDQPLP